MDIHDILSRLDGVKGGNGQWSAKCPAHDDNRQSLSVSVGKDGRVLMKCHAGCAVGDIAQAMGLSVKDLFVEQKHRDRRPSVVATYEYKDAEGNLLAQKQRRADKSFVWRRPDGHGGWVYNRNGVPATLFEAGTREQVVHIVEGEKDVLNMAKLGFYAVSGADGAGGNGKWRSEYTQRLTGLTAVIIQDNDAPGKAFAQEIAAALYGVAKSVRVVDLTQIWPEIPEHGDISDMLAVKGAEETTRLLMDLERRTPKWEPGTVETDPLLSLFKPLEDFQEEEARWLVKGWIPEGQISVIAADGGIGKTTLWCHIIAALSNGSTCILDPPDTVRSPMKITFLTTEDSVRKKLRKKLRLAGANMRNIITPDFAEDHDGLLRKVKFGTPEMEKMLRGIHPVLCIFDPVQGFTPPHVNMGSRNEMRDCMAPLIAIGEEINTTALIVCHTNKRKGAFGRDRIADSADIWDIARSVMMAGFTEEQGVRYLSNEKNNYAQLQETILFTIDEDEQIHKVGTSWKRDRDYILGAEAAKTAPVRGDCKAFIIHALEEAEGVMPTAKLEESAQSAGYSFASIKRAKNELKAEGAVKYFHTGPPKDRIWHTQLVNSSKFVEVSENTPTPFDEELPSDISEVV